MENVLGDGLKARQEEVADGEVARMLSVRKALISGVGFRVRLSMMSWVDMVKQGPFLVCPGRSTGSTHDHR